MRVLAAPCALLLAAPLARSQDTPCPPGGAVSSYRTALLPNGFVSILPDPGTVVAFLPPTDDACLTVPLPATFAFSLYGVPKAAMNVCTNGYVDFNAAIQNSFFNEHPGDAAIANDCVMPWHDDLILPLANPGASVAYNFGFPYGPDTLTIQWTDVGSVVAAGVGLGSFTFQVVLHASSDPLVPDAIDFRYDRASGPLPMTPCLVDPAFAFSTYAVSATVGTDSASGASASNVGVEATDRGAANTAFPPTDLRLLPTSFTGGEAAHSATTSVVAQPPYCTIVGLPGTVAVGPACGGFVCNDDDESAQTDGVVLPLPWKLNLAGRAMASVSISPNGFLRLGPGQFGVSGAGNGTLPNTAEPEAMLAPFNDDLEQTGAGGPILFHRVDGLPGARVMTFEWSHLSTFGGISGDCLGAGGDVSFQVKLFEGSAAAPAASAPPCPYDAVLPGDGNDRIEFWYDHAAFVPGPFAATIGWENHKGTIGAMLAGSPGIGAPPLDPAGAPGRVVVDPCDFGTMRFYGDRNHNAPAGFAACFPEIKGNAIPPRIGDPFGLQIVGGSPLGAAVFLIDFGGPIPGLRTPVPPGGLPSPFGGTLWVNLFGPGLFLLSCGVTPAGGPCESGCGVEIAIPPIAALVGGVVFVQGAVVSVAPFGLQIEFTEGAKVSIGA